RELPLLRRARSRLATREGAKPTEGAARETNLYARLAEGALAGALRSADASRRFAAAEGLALAGTDAPVSLVVRAGGDDEPAVRRAAFAVAEAARLGRALVEDADDGVREAAARALAPRVAHDAA